LNFIFFVSGALAPFHFYQSKYCSIAPEVHSPFKQLLFAGAVKAFISYPGMNAGAIHIKSLRDYLAF
jgi:hypothetical protein